MGIVFDPYIRDIKGAAVRKKTILDLAIEDRTLNSKEPIRMATDEFDAGMLDDVIDGQIRKEAKLALGKNVSDETVEAIVDATMEELGEGDPRFHRETLNALAEMNKRLVKAGVLIEDLGGGTGGLHTLAPAVGRLKGNVPGPYITKGKSGQEVRLHLIDENAGNDVTGLVPYMDPSNLRQPLKTTFGDVRGTAAAYYDNPSEYVGAQALKLMGIKAGVGNQDKVNGKTAFHRSDLIDTGTGKRIDVERGHNQMDRTTLPLQLTAALKIPNGSRGKSYNEGAKALEKHSNNSNARSLISTIDTIRNSGYARNNPDRYFYGKGFKTKDRGYSLEDKMDQVISLEYGPGSDRADKQGITVAPSDINMINVPETMAFIDQQGRNFSTTNNQSPVYVQSIDYADSAGGVIDKRSKVKANVPKGSVVLKNDPKRGVVAGSPINFNVIESNPLTQQLLDVLPYL